VFETEFVYFKDDSWPGILSTNQSKQQYFKQLKDGPEQGKDFG